MDEVRSRARHAGRRAHLHSYSVQAAEEPCRDDANSCPTRDDLARALTSVPNLLNIVARPRVQLLQKEGHFLRFKRIGVIGAGVIGSGVAQLFAQTGHEVTLVDRSEEQLDRARRSVARNLKMLSMLQKEHIDAKEVVARLHPATELDAVAGADFVIENITEDWELKRPVHEQLDAILGAGTPVAANTSAIPITRIAGAHRNPQRVVGAHFMNPVPLMPMVEIIRGMHTSEGTVEAARELVAQAGRESIVVHDSPGFVTNRVMMLMVNEAMFLVQEGVSTVADIDRLFKTCFGHKMGPLETADLIGLDTVLKSLEVIYAEINDDKYRPCPLLRKMVYAGTFGRKSGKGFYDYST
ncbi:MAG TPA: 3-hydroxyacyl-CoA dehydrogenase NAD-binding domain-containing protein [Thermoanaerobaculia bacterium]|nr:3-hydroxyacyl-CoA dehydrogenase NAD-binding domain-containing protein [Thermoanaerobaculia bacterium]